jgi:membrane protease YdiL (CAAX protease family)
VNPGLESALLLLAVWTLLAGAQAIGSRVGRGTALLLCFAVATLLLLAARRPGPRLPRPSAAALLAGLAGFLVFPACLLGIGAIGLAIGLQPGWTRPPGQGDPSLWISMLLLAPLFEELLYRERLLAALRDKLGTAASILATSLLFAITHPSPWAFLGTFLVGLLLGGVMAAGRCVTLCIALHSGLNLAVILCGIPASERAPSPVAGAAAGFPLLAVAVLWRRSVASRSRRRPSGEAPPV